MAQRLTSPTYLPGGYPDPAQLPDLSIGQWRGMGGAIGIVDKMPLHDALVFGCRATRVQGVVDSRLVIRPASTQPADVEVSDGVQEALDGIRGGLRAWLQTAAQASTRGAVYYEPLWKRQGDRVVPDRMLIVPLRTVFRWEANVRGGWDLQQLVYPSGGRWSMQYVTVPADELLGIRYMPEDDDPEPMAGILRACYGAFYRRQRVWTLRTDGLERAAYGVPQVVMGPDADPTKADEARNIAMMMRADFRAAQQMPPGYSIAFAPWPVAVDGMADALQRDGYEIAQAFACQHLLTGQSNGTEALIAVQVERIFQPAVRTDCEIIADALMPLVRQIVARNWPGRDVPEIGWDPPSDASTLEQVAAVRDAMASGLLKDPDGEVEVWARDMLNLPERPDAPPEIETAPDDTDDDEEPEAGEPADPSPVLDPEEAPEPEDDGESVEDVAAETDLVNDLLRAEAPPPEPVSAPAPDDVPAAVMVRFSADVLVAGPGRDVVGAERALRASETVVPLRALQRRAGAAVVAWVQAHADDYAQAVAQQAEAAPDADPTGAVPDTAGLRESLDASFSDAYDAGRRGAAAEWRRLSKPGASAGPVVDAVRERPTMGAEACGCGGVVCSEAKFRALLAAEVRRAEPAPGARGGAGRVSRIDPNDIILRWVTETARYVVERVQDAARFALSSLGPGGTLRGVPFDVVRDTVREAVRAISPKHLALDAAGPVDTLFGLGRMQQQVADGATVWLYSRSIESDSCQPCIDHDLTVVRAEQLDEYATPASWCEGGDLCNCLLIAMPTDQLPAGAREAT